MKPERNASPAMPTHPQPRMHACPTTHCSASTPGRRRCTRRALVAAAAAAVLRVCRGRLGPALGFLAAAAAARGCLKPGSFFTWMLTFLRAVDFTRAMAAGGSAGRSERSRRCGRLGPPRAAQRLCTSDLSAHAARGGAAGPGGPERWTSGVWGGLLRDLRRAVN